MKTRLPCGCYVSPIDGKRWATCPAHNGNKAKDELFLAKFRHGISLNKRGVK